MNIAKLCNIVSISSFDTDFSRRKTIFLPKNNRNL